MNDAIALIDGDDAFNVVYDYYRMFPQEIGALPAFGLNVIQPPVQLWNITFESLVERMNQHAANGIDAFLVVEHGFFDKNTAFLPIGLAMPLSSDTPKVFLVDKIIRLFERATDDLSAKESKQLDQDVQQALIPSEVFEKLNKDLRKLRGQKISQVEIRACQLGANPDVLDSLRVVLGAAFIAAPRKSMFYTRVNPGTPFRPVKGFERWRQQNSGAQLYSSTRLQVSMPQVARRCEVRDWWQPPTTGIWSVEQFALRIDGGPYDDIIPTRAATTSWDAVKDWVERHVMTGSGYTGRGPFGLAGFRSPGWDGAPFTVPLDPNYPLAIELRGVL